MAAVEKDKAETVQRIFIVEDHEVVRQGYILMLELEPGLTVCGEAGTAHEALERIPEAAPDLIIVDVSLPGMDGIELIRRLKEKDKDIRTLVVSGHDSDLYAKQALQAGANGYIDKAGVADIMGDAIRSVLNGEEYLSEHVRRSVRG